MKLSKLLSLGLVVSTLITSLTLSASAITPPIKLLLFILLNFLMPTLLLKSHQKLKILMAHPVLLALYPPQFSLKNLMTLSMEN